MTGAGKLRPTDPYPGRTGSGPAHLPFPLREVSQDAQATTRQTVTEFSQLNQIVVHGKGWQGKINHQRCVATPAALKTPWQAAG